MINVDISNIWSAASLPELLALEAEVAAAHLALSPDGTAADPWGWMTLPGRNSGVELERILASAEKIRADSDVLVVIGMDGGCLGGRAVVELLQGENRNLLRNPEGPRIFYAGDNLSTRSWNSLLRLLEGKEVSLCVVSRSGDRPESAIALRNLRWLLERRYGTEEANNRIYAVTDAGEGVLSRMAEEASWERFAYPVGAEGVWGVLGPAGLLPMAVAGIDIAAVLRGAMEAKETYDLRSFENPVWLYCAVRCLMARKGMTAELLESFEPGFGAMGRWWQALMASAGPLLPVAVRLPEDLYSLGERMLRSRGNLFASTLRFDPPEQTCTVIGDVRDPEGLHYLEGRRLDEVADLACQALADARSEGDLPAVGMDCGGLDAEKAGELIWFFQLAGAICAGIAGTGTQEPPVGQLYEEAFRRLLGQPQAEDR